ncbi:MAG: ABC transporter ATP-binding protein [Nitrospirota bacterium]
MIEVRKLRKLFPVQHKFWGKVDKFVHAVDDISFSIDRGRILGLVGESGSGKTTCGKLLVRLLEATSGTISIDGKDIEHRPGKLVEKRELKKFRKTVQMIFQDPYESLNPRMTVMDTIIEPLIIQQIGDSVSREEKVSQILEVVELTPSQDFIFRFPHELSGGQRQRVSIARALIIEPKFIVADEPVSMLDASIRVGIMNLLLRLKDKFELTYIFITHDLAVARYMCDELAVLYSGKIVEKGPTEDVIKNPQHPYTKSLLSAVPIPNPEYKRGRLEIKGGITTPINPGPECRFAARCPRVKDICKRQMPELKEIEEGHFVACYRG